MTEIQRKAVYALFVKQNHELDGLMDYSDFLSFLRNASAEEIWSVISANRTELTAITTKNIPQFSEKRDMSLRLLTWQGKLLHLRRKSKKPLRMSLKTLKYRPNWILLPAL